MTSRQEMPLFAYGTLMFPAIIESVIGRVPASRSAAIKGYRRLEVSGESFPGLFKGGDEMIDGLLYFDISEAEWEKLTQYEGGCYVLEEVTVLSFGMKTSALAYTIPSSQRSVLSEKVWNPDSSF
ncbi:MAG TPA: gamma-glutamylcyclotransferase family protein [Terrimicrobiaceae bacterium]